VLNTLENSAESSAIDFAVSTITARDPRQFGRKHGAAAKTGRESNDKENQSPAADGESARAPDVGTEDGQLTLGQVTSSEAQKRTKSQLHVPSSASAAAQAALLQSVHVRAAIATESTIQLRTLQQQPVRLRKNRRGVFSLSDSAPEASSRKMMFHSRENLTVWRHIFPKSGSKDKRVEVEWTAFERVMQSSPLNFRMEKPSGNGSARTFVRVDPVRGQESITLHRPHSSMIPIQYLRNWQRRFRRSLGMEAEDSMGPE